MSLRNLRSRRTGSAPESPESASSKTGADETVESGADESDAGGAGADDVSMPQYRFESRTAAVVILTYCVFLFYLMGVYCAPVVAFVLFSALHHARPKHE